MKTIILDTNFLFIPAQFKVDIFREIDRVITAPHQMAILDRSVEELEHLAKTAKGKDKEAAKLGLSLLKAKALKIIPTHSRAPVDDLIVELADKDTIVATQDQGLKRRLMGVPLIVLRAKKKLILVQ